MPKGGELMAEEFFIPKLGQTVEEVTLVNWLVADGEKVSQGQEMMEVETDKAIFPVEANAKGYFHIGPFKEGEVLPVLTVVGIIGTGNDKFVAGEGKVAGEPASGEQGTGESRFRRCPRSCNIRCAPAPVEVFASPRARKLAAEKVRRSVSGVAHRVWRHPRRRAGRGGLPGRGADDGGAADGGTQSNPGGSKGGRGGRRRPAGGDRHRPGR